MEIRDLPWKPLTKKTIPTRSYLLGYLESTNLLSCQLTYHGITFSLYSCFAIPYRVGQRTRKTITTEDTNKTQDTTQNHTLISIESKHVYK